MTDNDRIAAGDATNKERDKDMHKDIFRMVSALALVLIATTPVGAFGGGAVSATPSAPPAVNAEIQALTVPLRSDGSQEVRQIPLFSEQHADTVVASVNGEAITLKEFAMELASMHSDMDGSKAKGRQNFTETLDRLIAVKLIEQEALNIGFDRMPEVQSQVENFALKAMIQQLLAEQVTGVQVAEGEVDKLYRQMAIEARLLTYRITAETDAKTLLEKVRAGGDFKVLADQLVASGRAQGGETPEFARLNNLLPAIAQAVYPMQPGEVSEVFKADKGYLLFRLEDRRVYEDAETRLVAANRLLQQESRKQQLDYLKSLEEKYATVHDEAQATLDFAKIAAGNPEATGTEVFARLKADQRPVATVRSGAETVLITVAEIAGKLEATMYHGLDRVIDAKKLDEQKLSILTNRLVAITGKMEAQRRGIDKSAAFQEKIADFKERLLFDTFMAKAVVPGITVREEDVRKYYDEHLEEFSSPLMLKMKSLAFTDQASARDAVKKLQAGSDFKWVSANATNLADADHKELLALGDTLLSITALPEDLHEQVEAARQGDLYLYAGPGGLYYALLVDSAYPPVAKPYEEARQEIGRILYARKINEALAEWVSKLKKSYQTENYLVQNPPGH